MTHVLGGCAHTGPVNEPTQWYRDRCEAEWENRIRLGSCQEGWAARFPPPGFHAIPQLEAYAAEWRGLIFPL